MENWEKQYQNWLNNINQEYRKELELMPEITRKNNFSNFIEFGTAGIRAKREWGTNKINFITVGRFVSAFGKVLLNISEKEKITNGIAIIHDTRYKGKEFALKSAKILSALGFKAWLFENNDVCPTPVLSYLIIHNKLAGGINITASHNTKEYSGIKFYDHFGKQIALNIANEVKEELKKQNNNFNFEEDERNIKFLSSEKVLNNYLDILLTKIPILHQNIETKKENFNIIYTPNHGTGLKITEKILKKLNYSYHLVKEQIAQDPEFTNSPIPNPQFEFSFEYAKKYGDKYSSDLLIGSDPDADRFGVMVKSKGKWKLLTGNDIPILQLYFLSEITKKDKRKLDNYFTVKSIVTSNYAKNILKTINVKNFETFTGFKWIAEKTLEILNSNPQYKFLFAWEEANGSIIDWEIARDKDFFQSLINVLEIAYYYKKEFNKNLEDVLIEIQEKYGYYRNDLLILDLNDNTLDYFAIKKMFLKEIENKTFKNYPIIEIIDFAKGYQNFQKSEILMVKFDQNSFIAIRNSGTEPILKVYISIENKNQEKLDDLYFKIKKYFQNLINKS